MELTDAHVHFFPDGFQTRYGVLFPQERELEVYQQIRREYQIGDSLVVGYEGDPLYAGNNRYLAQLASQFHWVHALAFTHAAAPPSRPQLEQWWQARFVGLSLYLNSKADAAAFAAWPEETIRVLNEARAIISINLPNPFLPLIRATLEALAGCSILISHLGLPTALTKENGAQQVAALLDLAPLSHVGVKASAFYACGPQWHDYPHPFSYPVFTALLEAFGSKRLYWGSDFSPALEFISIPQSVAILQHFELNQEDQTAIYGGNLRRLLGARLSRCK